MLYQAIDRRVATRAEGEEIDQYESHKSLENQMKSVRLVDNIYNRFFGLNHALDASPKSLQMKIGTLEQTGRGRVQMKMCLEFLKLYCWCSVEKLWCSVDFVNTS